MASATAPEQVAEQPRTGGQIIDADVHEMPVSVKDLLPYLEPQWHKFIASGWSTPYFFSYAYPTESGFARADSIPDRGPAGSDPELLQRQLLEKYGVDVAILTGLFYPSDSKVQFEFATALASAYNDWLIERWLSFDDRLRASICVNVNEPEAAGREIERVGDHAGFLQVMLPPQQRDGYGQPEFAPIFRAATAKDLPVAIHPSSNAPTALGYPPYLVEWRICSAPQHHMSQVVSLIFSGVFERHPDLRMTLIEGGWTWLPHLLGRMDENFRSLRAETPWLRRMPSQYVLDHMRFTTQPMPDMNADQLLAFIELIGSEELLLFSSDYPHFDADNPFRAFPRVPEELMKKIQYENAKSWYRL